MSEEPRWQEPASPEEIAATVRKVVTAIEQPGAPDNAGCGHFGLHMTIGTEDVAVSSRGHFLQVTIYRRSGPPLNAQTKAMTCPTCGHTKHPPSYVHPGYPRGVHDKRMRALAQAFDCKVREHWNGGDWHNGISIVLAYDCPQAFVEAMARGRGGAGSYEKWAEKVTGGIAS